MVPPVAVAVAVAVAADPTRISRTDPLAPPVAGGLSFLAHANHWLTSLCHALSMMNLTRCSIAGRPPHSDWLDQLFRAKSVRSGGVIRRKISDVEREIGRDLLELEVRRRGFHMIESGNQLVILCSSEPLRVIC